MLCVFGFSVSRDSNWQLGDLLLIFKILFLYFLLSFYLASDRNCSLWFGSDPII